MSDTAWVGIATLAFFVTSGLCGYLSAKLRSIIRSIDTLHQKIDEKTTTLGNKLEMLLDTHERRDQERFEETIQRLTRVETLAENGNGHSKRKRRAA